MKGESLYKIATLMGNLSCDMQEALCSVNT